MAESLHKLQVLIEGNAKGLSKTAQEATSSIQKLQKKIQETVKTAQVFAGTKVRTEQYTQLQNDIDQAEKKVKKLIEAQKQINQYEPTKAYDDLENKLYSAEYEFRKLCETKKEFEKSGKSTIGINDDIIATQKKIKMLQNTMAKYRQMGMDKQETGEYSKMSADIERATSALDGLRAKMQSLKDSGKDVADSVFKRMSDQISEMSKTVISKLATGLKKSIGLVGALIQKFRTSKGAFSDPFRSGLKNILRYAIGIRSLFVLFRLLRSSIKDGLSNLSNYSQKTRSDLASIKDGINTIKNAMGNAFAPILSALAPAINSFIDMIVSALNAFAMFVATITGASVFTKATRAVSDYASAVSDAGGSAGDATKANEALKKSVMGFDTINKLDENSSSGSGGSGGGGGGGSSSGISFVEEAIPNNIANFAEMVKEAWKNADFTEIGEIVGTKLKNALDNIPWDGIQETCNKIAKSVATFLNGFFGTEGLADSIGKTIGQMLNTALGFAYTFITNFEWDTFGTFIGKSIASAIETFDFAKAGLTISGLANGLLTACKNALDNVSFTSLGSKVGQLVENAVNKIDFSTASIVFTNFTTGVFSACSSAIKEVNWGALGRQIGNFLAGINWESVLSSAGDLLVSGFCALLDFTAGLLSSLIKSINKVSWSEVANRAWNALKEAWRIVCDTEALSGIDDATLNAIGEALLVIGAGLASIKAVVGIVEFLTAVKLGLSALVAIAGDIVAFVSAIDPLVAGIIALGTALAYHAPQIKAGMATLDETLKADRNYYTSGNALSSVVQSLKDLTRECPITAQKAYELMEIISGDQLQGKPIAQIWKDVQDALADTGISTEELRTLFQQELEKMGVSVEDQKEILDSLDKQVEGMEDMHINLGISIEELGENLHEKISNFFGGLEEKKIKISAVVEDTGSKVKTFFSDVWNKLTNKDATLSAYANNKSTTIFPTLRGAWAEVNNKNATITAYANNKNSGTLSTLKSSFGALYNKTVKVTGQATNQNPSTLSKLVTSWRSLYSKTVKVTASVTTNLRKLFGLATGGSINRGTGQVSRWSAIPHYASGTNNAGNGGSLFVAGEAGAEIVGNIGGRSEVLNQSQLASVMYSAVMRAMTQAQSMQTGNNQTPQINVYVGGRRITDVVIEDINKQTKTTGVCPIMV